MGSDEIAAWLNYSAKIARISFDAEAAKSISCTEKTTFQLDGNRLISQAIGGGQFISICRFKPGEYDYRIELSEGAGQIPGASRTLEAKLIVQ